MAVGEIMMILPFMLLYRSTLVPLGRDLPGVILVLYLQTSDPGQHHQPLNQTYPTPWIPHLQPTPL